MNRRINLNSPQFSSLGIPGQPSWILIGTFLIAAMFGLLVVMLDYHAFFIFTVVLGIILALSSPYLGIFLILLVQPLFFPSWQEEGLGLGKVVYGVLFGAWFSAWAAAKIANRNVGSTVLWHPAARPALAFMVVLVMGMICGYFYGASLGDMLRDLSPYVGYLALLPVLDLVRRPDQAKKILVFLAVIGLPSFLLFTLYRVTLKQGLELPGLVFVQPAVAYWGPVGNSLWGVALLYRAWLPRLLAWGWILLYGVFLMFAGFRANLVAFLTGAGTAFMASGKLKRGSLARYLIPIFLVVIVGALMADFYGAITLPLSEITRSRYGTLFSPDQLSTDMSLEGRKLEGEALFEAFCQNPVVGVGFGRHLSFMWTDGNLRKDPYFQYHNGYLETLMKFGLVGTAVYFWFLGSILLMSFRIANSKSNLAARALGLGIVIWLVYSCVDSFSFSTFSDRGFSLTLGVVAGMLPALAHRHPLAKPQGSPLPHPRGRSSTR